MSSATPKVVQIGPYLVIEELGRGAMGVVFRGFDPSIARLVAIKVIRPQHLGTEQQTEEAFLRFMREANAAGRLSHPNIVTVYQMGEDRGYQYLAMEFVEGASLNKMMPPGAPMDPDLALRILRQIADALDHAHSQGVVHRDIKPANILIRASDGGVKIADFGIAHVVSQTLTQQGSTAGTPAYMAPEQIQGLRVDGKADQFSLAVLAYQMLTGTLPFGSSSEQTVFLAILSVKPRPAHQVNSSLGPRASQALERGMAKDPASRFATCSELVRVLTQSLSPGETVIAAPQVVELPPARNGAVIRSGPAVRSPGKMWIGVGAGAAAVLSLGFVLLPRPPVLRKTAAPHAAAASLQFPRSSTTNLPPRPITVPQTLKNQSKREARASREKPLTAPALSADQIRANQETSAKMSALDSRRQQLQAELIQARRDLETLRERLKDNAPEVQNAVEHVQDLRNSLNDVTNQLIDLKLSAPGSTPP